MAAVAARAARRAVVQVERGHLGRCDSGLDVQATLVAPPLHRDAGWREDDRDVAPQGRAEVDAAASEHDAFLAAWDPARRRRTDAAPALSWRRGCAGDGSSPRGRWWRRGELVVVVVDLEHVALGLGAAPRLGGALGRRLHADQLEVVVVIGRRRRARGRRRVEDLGFLRLVLVLVE